MPKKKGDVSKSGVKPDIIKCILSINKPVTEQYIREYLKEEYKKNVDQGNINRHLHELCEGLACIQLIPPVKKGLANHWNITTTEHLRNICKIFRSIQLNRYEKSLMIVLRKTGYDIQDLNGLIFYIQLFLSPSFFKKCIGKDINILLERAPELYTSKHYLKILSIKSQLHACYNSYIARYPNIKMSYESFVSMLTQMSQKDITSTKKFTKIWEEELLGISKEESDEIHGERTEEDLKIYEDMARIATDISLTESSIIREERFNLLFEQYLNLDILKNVISKEDLESALIIKAIEEEKNSWNYRSEKTDLYLKKLHLMILEQISKVLVKYKQPSIYFNHNISMDFVDMYKILKENFGSYSSYIRSFSCLTLDHSMEDKSKPNYCKEYLDSFLAEISKNDPNERSLYGFSSFRLSKSPFDREF